MIRLDQLRFHYEQMEMAFDARPAVYAGYAQLVADIIP